MLCLLPEFYFDSYGNIRSHGSVVEVLHDAFQTLPYWSGIMSNTNGYSNVVMDTHHYEVFSESQLALTYLEHIQVCISQLYRSQGSIISRTLSFHWPQSVCNVGTSAAQWATEQGNLWTVVGEWTTTLVSQFLYIFPILSK